LKQFIKINDIWGRLYLLNIRTILAVITNDREDEDYSAANSIIQYGSGFMDEVFVKRDVLYMEALINKVENEN
jgi:hypothetical protein